MLFRSKFALQSHAANGAMSRRRFISRQRSWHGNTLGALSISGFEARRAPFEGALIEASLLSPVNVYRPPENVAPEDVAQYCAGELEREIERLGPENVAAFVFEPVVGAAGGAVPAPPGYARLVREICDRHGVLMIADEVMCGAGRCGTWRALAHDGVAPDIMSIAKGLAGGYMPLGAAVYQGRIHDRLIEAHGIVNTGHTYSGHTASCAAGLAVQRIILRDRLVEKVARDGAYMFARLRETLGEHDRVGDIRGRGMFIGIEIVADRETKAPFDPGLALHQRIREQSFADGLICYPVAGNIDGRRGDLVILSPPFTATRAELDEIVGRLVEVSELVLLCGVGDLDSTPRLPFPIGVVAGERSRAADRVHAQVAAGFERVVRMPLKEVASDQFHRDPSLFSPDLFHPNASYENRWTDQ